MNMRIIFLIFFRRKPYLFYFFKEKKKKKDFGSFSHFPEKKCKNVFFFIDRKP